MPDAKGNIILRKNLLSHPKGFPLRGNVIHLAVRSTKAFLLEGNVIPEEMLTEQVEILRVM